MCVALTDVDASSTTKRLQKKKQVTLAAAFSTVVPYDKKGWQAITDAVTHYIAKGMVLIYTVEKKRFYYDAANDAPLFLVC